MIFGKDIEIVGLNRLDDNGKDILNKLFPEYYSKIKRLLKNDLKIKLHIKNYKKEGNRKKHSITIRILAPTRTFQASAFDWDFARVLHKIFKDVIREIEHSFRDK